MTFFPQLKNKNDKSKISLNTLFYSILVQHVYFMVYSRESTDGICIFIQI